MRIEHDYKRGGALAYPAARDVHRGQVTGRCEHTTGIAPFSRLVSQVIATEPYASADRVFWIVDNGSSHRGAASTRRMARAWPNAHLIHLPAHASWLDQAEIYFSIVQRKALSPNDFTDLAQIRDRLAAFETRYNQIARPFGWKFTRTDLDHLLHRIDAHPKDPALRPGSMNSTPANLRARPLRRCRKITRSLLESGTLVCYGRYDGNQGDAGGEVRGDLPASG